MAGKIEQCERTSLCFPEKIADRFSHSLARGILIEEHMRVLYLETAGVNQGPAHLQGVIGGAFKFRNFNVHVLVHPDNNGTPWFCHGLVTASFDLEAALQK